MNGIFLQGGGAKGAFQAGALKALKEKNIDFDVIAGTSIGAINGGVLFYDKIDNLENIWTVENSFDLGNIDRDDIVIDTNQAIDLLRKEVNFGIKVGTNKKFFVNYVKIESGVISERYVDISQKCNKEIFDYMRFSSLLPKRKGTKISKDTYRTKDAIENFKEDIEIGIYDDMRLDGGVVNNVFLEPFIDNKVDKLYMIVFRSNFSIPKYILENYEENQIVVIASDYKYKDTDTLNFDKIFLEDNFNLGYEKTIKIL